ncbi:MAG: alpha/beta hydrolase [Anaerolineae bacterium]|nr:alpha/beta hydrolase [Anaerolineae bacterium]
MNINYRFRSEPVILDAAEREKAPGQFVTLSGGVTHYACAGPPRKTLTVLVHGFSVPYFIWDPTFEGLASAGLHVLRYDLFGRGYSDRPDVVYNQACFDRQLAELLDTLEIQQPVNLVGLSMGGAVAVGFADRHPDRVKRLVLIDPAGMPLKQSPLMKVFLLPLWGEFLFDRFAEKFIVASLAKDFYSPELLEKIESRYRVQMQYSGFRRALLSTLRAGPLQSMAAAYRRVGQHPCPVLLIWGKQDRTVPFEISRQVRSALPHAEFHAIEGAGHIPHFEQPERINPLLIRFLTAQQTAKAHSG